MRRVARIIVMMIVSTVVFARDDVTTFASVREVPASPLLPANIVVDARLLDIVGEMLRSSPTFREQCRQLARNKRLMVRMDVDDGEASAMRTHRAEAQIRRYQYGLIIARIRLWSVSGADELIAHELEHVLEYAEGVSFPAESFRHSARVWVAARGSYETARAITVGQRVAEEMSRGRPANARRATR